VESPSFFNRLAQSGQTTGAPVPVASPLPETSEQETREGGVMTLKVKTSLKAGGESLNHNEMLRS
jgi:hypothetical protein